MDITIPRLVAQGIRLQAFEFASRLGAKIAVPGRKWRYSLFNSLLAGNLGRRRVRDGLRPQPASAVSVGNFRTVKADLVALIRRAQKDAEPVNFPLRVFFCLFVAPVNCDPSPIPDRR
jgi:hypothetical protein